MFYPTRYRDNQQDSCLDLIFTNEPPRDKTNNVAVRPAKTQISLGIRPVWSESSLCAQWVAKAPSYLHVDSEDSDQTGQMPRLIWVFAGRTLTLLVLSEGGSFTNEDLMIDNLQYHSSLGVSDNLVLLFDFKCYIPPENQGPPRRNFFKGDYEAMREILLESAWDFDHLESINDIWNLFKTRLCQIITDFVPQSACSHSYRKTWMNKNTAGAIDRKRRAWTKLRHCNNTENCDNYKNQWNLCTNEIRTAKHNYIRNICMNVKEKPKVFWCYIKSKSKTRDKVYDLMQEDGLMTVNSKEKAEVFK